MLNNVAIPSTVKMMPTNTRPTTVAMVYFRNCFIISNIYFLWVSNMCRVEKMFFSEIQRQFYGAVVGA